MDYSIGRKITPDDIEFARREIKYKELLSVAPHVCRECAQLTATGEGSDIFPDCKIGEEPSFCTLNGPPLLGEKSPWKRRDDGSWYLASYNPTFLLAELVPAGGFIRISVMGALDVDSVKRPNMEAAKNRALEMIRKICTESLVAISEIEGK